MLSKRSMSVPIIDGMIRDVPRGTWHSGDGSRGRQSLK